MSHEVYQPTSEMHLFIIWITYIPHSPFCFLLLLPPTAIINIPHLSSLPYPIDISPRLLPPTPVLWQQNAKSQIHCLLPEYGMVVPESV